ncbi:MAG: OPT family oligopeptide transporter [Planctomycetota bacterium]
MSVAHSYRPIRYGLYPELTWPAVLVGWFLGAIIAVSIGYASLILGFSIEGSELAAILGWGILRGVLRRTSIIENNINQTIASAVNGASAGMMFSIPALFILATPERDPEGQFAALTEFNVGLMVLACITGGILGLSFIIPLRKQMIDFDRLAYPGGIAVAAILKSPGAGMKKAILLLGGGAISATFYLLVVTFTGKDHPQWAFGDQLNAPPCLNLTLFLSLMTVGVGFLSGKGGFWFGAGGFICYWFLAPALSQFGVGTDDLIDNPNALRTTLFRPTGIGMLIGAAVGGIVAAFPLIRSALKSMHEARHRPTGDGGRLRSDEMPVRLLYLGVAAGVVVLAVICFHSVNDPHMTLWRAAIMAVLGTAWVWVAGVIVSECLGRTNWSPLSGMTLIAVTILLLIAQAGMEAPSAVLSSVIIGAAICVAIAQAGDMMLDLKSGYLVGAMPRRQQTAQFIGSWLGPLIIIGLIFVLHKQYTLGSESLPAPQGSALASMIEGIVKQDVPSYRYVAGAGLGAVLAFSGLGGIGVLIGLGFYMPFDIVLTYTIGNVLRITADRFAGKRFSEQVGVPIAAGLIVGEALMGVGYAFYQILSP